MLKVKELISRQLLCDFFTHRKSWISQYQRRCINYSNV